MWEFISNNAIALSAGFISLLALVTAVYHGLASRKHFRLSVKPNLSIEFGADTNDNFIHISICNEGLGPAIIKSIAIVSEEGIIYPKAPEEVTKILDEIYNSALFPTAVSLPQLHEALSTKKSITLIKIKIASSNVIMVGITELMKKFIPFKIKIVYQSFYKEKFSAEYPPKFG